MRILSLMVIVRFKYLISGANVHNLVYFLRAVFKCFFLINILLKKNCKNYVCESFS